MDQHMESSKTQECKSECAGVEQARERKIAADYMRETHGLKENKKPDYKPVGKSRKQKY